MRISQIMKIVVDDKIPYIHEALEQLGCSVKYVSGAVIGPADVHDADALIVRTRTRCDAALLNRSSVKFIATATIGFDHIDTNYLQQAGIAWMNCPGCNASSVEQYVSSVLLLLQRDKGRRLSDLTIGVVGCGHVGSKVARASVGYGMCVLLCDPPRVEAGDTGAFEPAGVVLAAGVKPLPAGCKPQFVSIDDVARECDVITFHVPLQRSGRHSTLHLAGEAFFDSLRKRPVIINTSRGAVVDNQALKRAIIYNKVQNAVIDTWENEPLIDRELLRAVWIGTPHIAGYSADGKVNADNMVLDGLCRHFGLPRPALIMPPPLPASFRPAPSPEALRLQLYNPLNDSSRLKAAPEAFEQLRGNYPLRREKL